VKETNYQKKIMNDIYALGGWSVNGQFTKRGELDLQCGFPVDTRLLYLAVEVKTPTAYATLMKGLVLENGYYKIVDKKKLKEHEHMQVYKVNQIRKRGGLALFAHSIEQVKEYVNECTNSKTLSN
jgi:hypothetical protein